MEHVECTQTDVVEAVRVLGRATVDDIARHVLGRSVRSTDAAYTYLRKLANAAADVGALVASLRGRNKYYMPGLPPAGSVGTRAFTAESRTITVPACVPEHVRDYHNTLARQLDRYQLVGALNQYPGITVTPNASVAEMRRLLVMLRIRDTNGRTFGECHG